MSHPRLLWQVNKCLIQLVSTGGGDDDDKVEMNWKEKSCLYSSSRLLRGSGLRSEAVAAGVWAAPSLIAVTFLSSSFWLNCTAADGACDSYAIQCSLWSAPSEPPLSTHCLSTLNQQSPTLRCTPPLSQQATPRLCRRSPRSQWPSGGVSRALLTHRSEQNCLKTISERRTCVRRRKQESGPIYHQVYDSLLSHQGEGPKPNLKSQKPVIRINNSPRVTEH